jgi:hypothetical protein
LNDELSLDIQEEKGRGDETIKGSMRKSPGSKKNGLFLFLSRDRIVLSSYIQPNSIRCPPCGQGGITVFNLQNSSPALLLPEGSKNPSLFKRGFKSFL